MLRFLSFVGLYALIFIPEALGLLGFSPSARSSIRHAPGRIKMGLQVGDTFPPTALKNWGVAGKNCIVYFYGADGSPSCSKQAQGFSLSGIAVPVVGVRNDKSVKEDWSYPGVKFVVDEGDSIRKEIGIATDFFVLGGRETYAVASSGEVSMVFNDQFAVDKHIAKAIEASEEFPAEGGGGVGGFSFPDFGALFGQQQ